MGNTNTSAHRLSPGEVEKLWAGWHQGLAHHKIAKLVGIKPPSVFEFLAKFGGIEPVPRKRRDGFLSNVERELAFILDRSRHPALSLSALDHPQNSLSTV